VRSLTDKGYDSEKNGAACGEQSRIPVIPHRLNTKNKPSFFPKRLYKGLARIEQTIGKLKRFKRIALRCEKTALSFVALVAFACKLILVKSVRRA
jgi:transposase